MKTNPQQVFSLVTPKPQFIFYHFIFRKPINSKKIIFLES